MERRLRLYYFTLLPIALVIIYPFLLKEGGKGMRVFFYFLGTGLPFLLLNVGRSLYKGKKAIDIINVAYVVLLFLYGLLVLSFKDWLVVVLLYLPFISLVILESFKQNRYLILNIASISHLVLFIAYAISL
ncbi:hypothetical protein SAMN04488018_10580 [Myroides marinus]|uniref:Uncharacterized protein n=1 Tax=Myroides marinus TaxID=703342 RepID=A0A1H6TXJ9_9FLAO|nr:hypothetical protein [Myroides marinus]SEI81967.1 hypothetical protein SAMN04488018_10580 [Myroides marinus]